MGWWSVTILGGDLPLDILDKVEDLTGLNDLYPLAEINQDTKKQLKNKLDQNLELWTSEILQDCEEDEQNVVLQVLALISLAAGSNISNELKTRFVEAAKNDEWANSTEKDPDVPQRKLIMKQLIDALETHDGKSVLLQEETLMESFSKSEDQSMINKNTQKSQNITDAELDEYIRKEYGNPEDLIPDLPLHLQESVKKLRESEEELKQILQTQPTKDQIAQYAGIDIETVDYLKNLLGKLNLGK